MVRGYVRQTTWKDLDMYPYSTGKRAPFALALPQYLPTPGAQPGEIFVFGVLWECLLTGVKWFAASWEPDWKKPIHTSRNGISQG